MKDLRLNAFINIKSDRLLGLGFTVLPQFAREAFARPEAIRVVTGEPMVVDTLWLLHRAEWPLSARAGRVLDALKPTLGGPL
ncbi:hypothetical protein [Vreelandella subglaciescola]|uniref:LysR substrate binding domain-containing protein n=1 Tax=Vreelandella subglaciescola TaxID=29571 RepID=A0A1M7GAH6_9GAMM|nr:hypothetical protein [Halomonas subglaciescola]SHM13125.1 hypothetical protein SAMN05878437_1381 [Halomonas subglaciescola]